MELFEQLYGHPSSTLLYFSFAWLCIRASRFAPAKTQKYFYFFSVLWLLSVVGYWFEFDNTFVVTITLIPMIFIWWFIFNPLWLLVPTLKTEGEFKVPSWFKKESFLIIGGCIITMFIWQKL